MTDEELRKLCEAATPGPWREERIRGWSIHVVAPLANVIDDNDNQIADCYDNTQGTEQQCAANAAFIAAARSALPALLDRAHAAEGEVERLRADLDLAGPDSACCRARHRAEDEVTTLTARLRECEAERDAARASLARTAAIVRDFRDDIERASRYLESRGKGGQQVSPTHEFAAVPPSGLSRMHRVARELTMATSSAEVSLARPSPATDKEE